MEPSVLVEGRGGERGGALRVQEYVSALPARDVDQAHIGGTSTSLETEKPRQV